MRVLRTDSLTLLPQTAAHAAEMFDVLCDPAIYEFEDKPPVSVAWLHERYTKLESRRSPDGTEQWLNWVMQTPDLTLTGYVQATVIDAQSTALVAYVVGSRFWGRGLALQAVRAMMLELAAQYGVRHFEATLRQSNGRSLRLLERLGFSRAPPQRELPSWVDADEWLMLRAVAA